MITIGYKSKVSSLLRALSTIAIGLVMIVSNNATVSVVRIIAALLFAAGVISFIYGYLNKKRGILSLMSINAVVDIVIGLILFLFPEPVTHIIVYLIGVLLLFLGAIQLLALSSIMSLLGSGFMSLALSIATIIGGILLLFNPFTMKITGVIAGAALVVYGVQELISSWRMDKAKKVYEIKFGPKPEGRPAPSNEFEGVKDVDYQKVEDN